MLVLLVLAMVVVVMTKEGGRGRMLPYRRRGMAGRVRSLIRSRRWKGHDIRRTIIGKIPTTSSTKDTMHGIPPLQLPAAASTHRGRWGGHGGGIGVVVGLGAGERRGGRMGKVIPASSIPVAVAAEQPISTAAATMVRG